MPELFEVLAPERALELLLEHVVAESRADRCPTAQALGRTLAQTVIAPESLPAFRRSTMDG